MRKIGLQISSSKQKGADSVDFQKYKKILIFGLGTLAFLIMVSLGVYLVLMVITTCMKKCYILTWGTKCCVTVFLGLGMWATSASIKMMMFSTVAVNSCEYYPKLVEDPHFLRNFTDGQSTIDFFKVCVYSSGSGDVFELVPEKSDFKQLEEQMKKVDEFDSYDSFLADFKDLKESLTLKGYHDDFLPRLISFEMDDPFPEH